MRSIQIVAQLLLAAFLGGCTTGGGFGGFNCPLNVPSCCYDALFGCGTFDLPEGCSCSQYGFFAKQNILDLQYVSAAPRLRATSLSGTWTGTLQRQSSSCSGLSSSINGMLRVYDSRRSVSVVVPGYGTMKGSRTTKGYRVNGRYSSFLLACTAKISSSFSRSSLSRGLFTANLDYVCGSRVACSAQYKGTITKLR